MNLVKFKNWLINNLWLEFITIACLFFVFFEIQCYRKFMFPVLDLGLYNRHMWALAHLNFSANPLKGFNLLGDHAHFVLLFFAPFYALFKSPLFLLVLQALAIGLSGWPIYLIANKFFKNNILATFCLIPYYLYFGFHSALFYPFHVAPLAVLPIAFALYFLLEKKYKYMLFALFFMLITKEEMPLLLIMFGLYLIVLQKQWKLGALLIGISAPYFLFVTKYWLPAISKIRYYYSDAGDLGNSYSEIFINSLMHPLKLVNKLIIPEQKIIVIKAMILSFAGFSLVGIEILILLLPLWLGRFLSVEPWRWEITKHYSANQGPILMIAAIIGIYRISSLVKTTKIRNVIIGVSLALCLVSTMYVDFVLAKPTPLTFYYHRSFYRLNNVERSAWQAVKLIPAEASVGVQSAFPQLTSRKEVYNIPLDLNRVKPDYLVMSSKLDRWPFSSDQEYFAFIENAKEFGYKSIFDQNSVIVLKKSTQ